MTLTYMSNKKGSRGMGWIILAHDSDQCERSNEPLHFLNERKCLEQLYKKACDLYGSLCQRLFKVNGMEFVSRRCEFGDLHNFPPHYPCLC